MSLVAFLGAVGIGFVFVKQSAMPGLYQIAWKGAAVGLLALYALLRHGSRVGTISSDC